MAQAAVTLQYVRISNPSPNPGFKINACPRQAEVASGKLDFSLTYLLPDGQANKVYSIWNNIKQNYLEMQCRSAVVATKRNVSRESCSLLYFSTSQSSLSALCLIGRTSLVAINTSQLLANYSILILALQLLGTKCNVLFSGKKIFNACRINLCY